MKRFIVFILIFLSFIALYNGRIIKDAVFGAFGDTSYNNTDFSGAKNHYNNMLKNLSGSTSLEADTLYNLWNTLYRLGEQEQGSKRIELWKESIGDYTKSLSIRIDKQTEENLAFVKEKLAKEEKEQQQKKQEQEKEQEQKNWSGSSDKKEQTNSGAENKENPQKNKTWSGIKNEDKKKDWDKQETQKKDQTKQQPKTWNWSNGGSYNPIGWQNKDDTISKLSDSDKQELKQYLEQLKKFEKQNGKLLNPEKPNQVGSISDQIRNFFGDNSFFQDVIPSNNGKKDW